jgi:hypothetical protein
MAGKHRARLTRAKQGLAALAVAAVAGSLFASGSGTASAASDAGGWDAGTYTGTWATGAPDEKWSTTQGSTVTFSVNVASGGGTISVYGNKDTGGGKASVQVDAQTATTVDTYDPTPPPGINRNWFTSPWLAEGPHKVKVTVLNQKRTEATGTAISIKGVNTTNGSIVWPGTSTTTPTTTPKITATAVAGSGQATLSYEATNIPDPATAGVWVQKADGTAGKWYRALKGSHTFTGLTNGVETTLEAYVVRDGGANLASTSTKVTPTGSSTPPPTGTDGPTKTGFVTGYSYYDNDPPGTSAIAYESVMPNRTGAGGSGTFTDPITAAVPSGTLAPGTKVYVPHVKRYFIVEDECATSHSAPNGCTADLDLWVDGRTAGEASSDACMARITGDYQYIVNPASGKAVTVGTVCG